MTDEIERRPAATNPWYVLATVAGEQREEEWDDDLHAKNRRYWNGWAGAATELRQSEGRLTVDRELKRATEADLAPLSDAERIGDRIRAALSARGAGKMPSPEERTPISAAPICGRVDL